MPVECATFLHSLLEKDAYHHYLSWSPDGSKLASSSEENGIAIWDPFKGLKLLNLMEGKRNSFGLDWSPDGRNLVASPMNALEVFASDRPGGRVVEERGYCYLSATWSPDGSMVAAITGSSSSSCDYEITVWRTRDFARDLTLTADGDRFNALQWQPGTGLLAACSQSGRVYVWDVTTGRLQADRSAHGDEIYDLAWAPDGTLLATGCKDGTIGIWKADSEGAVRVLNPGSVVSLGFSFDGTMLAARGMDSKISIWNVTDFQLIGVIDEQDYSSNIYTKMAWHPSRNVIAFVGKHPQEGHASAIHIYLIGSEEELVSRGMGEPAHTLSHDDDGGDAMGNEQNSDTDATTTQASAESAARARQRFDAFAKSLEKEVEQVREMDLTPADRKAEQLLAQEFALAWRELAKAGTIEETRRPRAYLLFLQGRLAANVVYAYIGHDIETTPDNLGGFLVHKAVYGALDAVAGSSQRLDKKWATRGVAWIEESVKLDEVPEADYNLAWLYEQLADWQHALNAYERVELSDDIELSAAASKAVMRVKPKAQVARSASTAPRVEHPAVEGLPKSKVTACLLGIFLGFAGAHRFYLGFTGIGLAQIAATVCTCGIGGLWGFFEGLLILAGVFTKDANGNALV